MRGLVALASFHEGLWPREYRHSRLTHLAKSSESVAEFEAVRGQRPNESRVRYEGEQAVFVGVLRLGRRRGGRMSC